MTTESHIQTGPGGTVFAGPDSVKLYQAAVLRSAIRTYVFTGMRVNRAYTARNMAMAASRITGKPYKASKASLTQARADLGAWIDANLVPVVEGA